MPTAPVFVPAAHSVPLISSGICGSVFSPLASWPQVPAEATRFQFGQGWLDTTEPAFAPGEVRVGALNHELAVWADLAGPATDRAHPADDHRLWERGDVFECFIQAFGEESYHEYHVAPDGDVTHLTFPGQWERSGDLAPYVQSPAGLRVRVQVEADCWRVFALIPLPTGRCFDSPLQGTWRVSFGRYDHRSGRDPVISSTSPHARPDFHRRGEWDLIRIGTTA